MIANHKNQYAFFDYYEPADDMDHPMVLQGWSFLLVILEPFKVPNKKILKTFKSVTITECWLKCKQTDGCKDIGTAIDRNVRIITCYLLESEEKGFENEDTFLEMNHIHSVTVGSFIFMNLWFIENFPNIFRSFLGTVDPRSL